MPQDLRLPKDMGLKTIVSSLRKTLSTSSKLATKYGIDLAIHNHPKPSHYWNPDTVLKVCKGRSKRIGACATRALAAVGKEPDRVFKKLEGRIINFHFKDLNKGGGDARHVPWGTGVCDVKGMLTEVRRQRIKAAS